MGEIGEILNVSQVQALNNHSLYTKEDMREQTDEQLLSIEGIGKAALKKLREGIKRLPSIEGDAISLVYMSIRKDGERLNVSPGDVIPAKFDAKTRVEQGKARWRTPQDK